MNNLELDRLKREYQIKKTLLIPLTNDERIKLNSLKQKILFLMQGV